MPPLTRRTRAALGLAALVVALAAWQGVAAGAIVTTGATLEGVTSDSAPPGSVIPARVTAKVGSPSIWRATSVQFDQQRPACVNHADQGPGDRAVSFSAVAPGDPGEYDVTFTPSESDSCKGAAGTPFTLEAGLRVTAPGPNPNLPPRCGIDVMLVLDESGSIKSSGATEKVRDAARAFLSSLSGTGAAVSIVDFSTSAGRPVGYTTVTPESIADVFEPYLRNGYRPSGWTNWEAALTEVREANTVGPVADLVVFITDGDPTARNNPPGRPITGLKEGDVTAMRPALQQADLVKAQGSHMFALGVGAAVTKPESARRLTAISGFDQLPPAGLETADYTLVEDFDDLAEALRQIATALCAASVTITKLVDEGDGTYRPDPGWQFTATVSTKPGTYSWVQPAAPPKTGPRTQTTDKDGVATFQWKPTSSSAVSTISIEEDLKPGYEFVDAVCELSNPGVTKRRVIRDRTPDETTGTLKPGEYGKCTVRNRIVPGTIEIEKIANPEGSQPFEFTGSGPLGSFTLVDDGQGQQSSRTFTGLPPGSYTIAETVPSGWALSNVTCVGQPAVAMSPRATVTLAPGGSAVCTFRNTSTSPVNPPDPPTPPTPPNPPQPPQPPIPPVHPFGVAQLRVEKTAPAVARVGETIQFELTVTNVGPDAARSVQLADVPPPALSLTGLRATGGVQLVRGNAYWQLGTLAPGASRTVRGSVVVDAGTPGRKRNRVFATAVNAQLVQDRVDTRLLQRRPVTPPVTG